MSDIELMNSLQVLDSQLQALTQKLQAIADIEKDTAAIEISYLQSICDNLEIYESLPRNTE